MRLYDLDIKDKFKYLSGKDSWSLPLFFEKEILRMSDGPHGLRYVYKEENMRQYAEKSIAYPSLSTLANSRDKETLYMVGKSLANDCIERKVDVLLAPGVNLKRHPYCGRNFEYFSEDAFLSGKLASCYINGIQSKGIGACIKHFACNNRERDRFFESSEVDVRALNEEYIRPFKIAINESNPWLLMCAYNPINGIYASENEYLLINRLRNKLNYKGVTVSDWGAVRNRAISLKAGIDIAMPYESHFLEDLNAGLNIKYIDENDVNRSIKNIDNLLLKIKESENKRVIDLSPIDRLNLVESAEEESIVLLKNDDNILPLKDNKENILVIGDYAINPIIGGEGSSRIDPISQNFSLVNEFINANYTVKYEAAYNQRYDLIQPFGVKKAILEAKKASKVIVCVGKTLKDEKEESDKMTIKLNPFFEELVEAVSKVNKNIIVCLYAGGQVDLTSIEKSSKAIVYAGLGGEKVNKALCNVLIGKVSPSGKLAETFLNGDIDLEIKKGTFFYEKYNEGTLIGYKRYLENGNLNVLYPFGHGLSYAKFSYHDLEIKQIEELKFEVSFVIKNESDIDAKCVSEIYVSNKERMVETPIKSLIAFDKSMIKANSKKRIKIVLEKDAFSYYSQVLDDDYVEDGLYKIFVSSSLVTDELVGTIEIISENKFKYSRY